MKMLSPSLAALLVAMALAVTSCQTSRVTAGGTADCDLFFDNTNQRGVRNNAVNPSFKRGPEDPSVLCGLYTYHWNNGRGKAPGSIGLVNRTKNVKYGPYRATATPGQGGAPNVNWYVLLSPRIEIKPGQYEVIDSDRNSWSQNAASQNKGFAKVWLKHAL